MVHYYASALFIQIIIYGSFAIIFINILKLSLRFLILFYDRLIMIVLILQKETILYFF